MGQEVGLWLGMSDNDFRRRRVQAQTLLLLPALLLVYIRSFVFSPPPSQFSFLFYYFFFLTPPARVLFASNLMRQKLCAKCGVPDGWWRVGVAKWMGHGSWVIR